MGTKRLPFNRSAEFVSELESLPFTRTFAVRATPGGFQRVSVFFFSLERNPPQPFFLTHICFFLYFLVELKKWKRCGDLSLI